MERDTGIPPGDRLAALSRIVPGAIHENAPVGIRTRAPGSTGGDHRPLDHRGSGRRKVRTLIILSYETGEHWFLCISPTDSRFPRLDEHATGRALESPFPFYPREVMWLASKAIRFKPQT